jgi:hypothetical protein
VVGSVFPWSCELMARVGGKEKMVAFFSGQINQYVDATSQQCGAAAYQPFPELPALVSQLGGEEMNGACPTGAWGHHEPSRICDAPLSPER